LTVSAIVAFPCIVPEIAVTVTIEVLAVAGVTDVPPFPLELVQPERIPRPAQAIASSSQWCQQRRFLHPKNPTVRTSAVYGKNGRDPAGNADDCVPVEMVSWVVAAPPEGVTVDWSKVQVAPAGSPVHAKTTAESNPFTGVTVRMTDPWLPELTVSEGVETASRKLGCGESIV
jgi:hypothetical protein